MGWGRFPLIKWLSKILKGRRIEMFIEKIRCWIGVQYSVKYERLFWLVLDSLFNFNAVERVEIWRDVTELETLRVLEAA